ncbi:S-layer homology domain-containing protein [Brevibacillus massiliensis]|uniref:S-layer homology domain-containing protein n=2 Tax=Brevibacillus massiliensis TaxID=1118054 RepID=UPI0003727EE6|nr:S-layer homology domain-containing protein [Brevibacillus massiliensis]
MVCSMIPLQVAESAEHSSAELEHHWAKQVIERWLDKGLIKGYSDGTILPDNPITRAEMVALINRAVGFSEQAAAHFFDVHTTDWFAREIAVATAARYVNGYGDGTFLPNHPITRQEVAVMVVRQGRRRGVPGMRRSQRSKTDWSRPRVTAVRR